MKTRIAALCSAMILTGCAIGAPETHDDDPMLDTGTAALLEGTPESISVLLFVNDPSTTYQLLDKTVRLDKRAAEAIIRHRNGHDGYHLTHDDDPIDTLHELDSLHYVGPHAIGLMVDYLWAETLVPTGDDPLGAWDDVEFTVDEAELTLALANQAPYDRLDTTIGLDSRAADAIVAARPIHSILELSQLYWMGTHGLGLLKNYALSSF